MKNLKIVLLTIILVLSCKSETKQGNIDFLEDSESIISNVSNLFLIENRKSFVLSKEDEMLFFNSLPNSFKSFEKYYGQRYILSDSRKISLSVGFHFSVLYLNLYYIDNKEKILKLFNIAKDAKIKNDSDMELQSCVQFMFAKHVSEACSVFERLDSEAIFDFWTFYFYSPHPKSYDEVFNVMHDRYRKENRRVARLMKEAYFEL